MIWLRCDIAVLEAVLGASVVDIKARIKRHCASRHARSVREASPDEALGLQHGEHLHADDAILTSSHTVKVKYSETYKGLPIIGNGVVMEQTLSGKYTDDISGHLLEGIESDVPSIKPQLSPEDALRIAVTSYGRYSEHAIFHPDQDCKLVIYTKLEGEANDNDNAKAVLAYDLRFAISDPYFPAEPHYIIDANSGEVLHHTNLIEAHGTLLKRRLNLHHSVHTLDIEGKGGNEKVGSYQYGKDVEMLQVMTEDDVTCYVQNDNVAVVNLNFSTVVDDLDKDRTQGYKFPCKNGIHDTVNGGYSPISDALFFFNKVHDMYQQYELRPLKDRAIMVVHYGNGLENAYYMPGYNFMVIGDGSSRFHPLVGLGVVAHEVGTFFKI